MNTQPGTNTNPTAVALARIVLSAEIMYNSARNSGHVAPQHERDAYAAILHAVADIATRNGNDPGEVIEGASEIVEEADRKATR